MPSALFRLPTTPEYLSNDDNLYQDEYIHPYSLLYDVFRGYVNRLDINHTTQNQDALINCSGGKKKKGRKVEEYSVFRLKVKEVAQVKGMSQRQLFLRSGVDITTIRKLFRDPHTVVTVETLTRLAKVLDVDVSELIESVPDKLGNAPTP